MASPLTPRTSLLPFLALAGAAAIAAYAVMARRGPQPQPVLPRVRSPSVPPKPAAMPAAVSANVAARPGHAENASYVRPAGPEAMRDPPRRWDAADEASDESFPASDPPSTY